MNDYIFFRINTFQMSKMSGNSPPTKKFKKTSSEIGTTSKTSNFLNDVAAERNKVS